MSITPSEKACLSVSRRRPCTGRRVRPIGQEPNVGNAQIRTLLDRQKEQIFAECQAEVKKHEFQADHDRRSVRKLGEIIESQQKKNFIAFKLKNFNDEINNFFMNGYYSKIRNYVNEVHSKSLNEMEELKKFQSSHLRHHCKTQISRGSSDYFGTYWQGTRIAD